MKLQNDLNIGSHLLMVCKQNIWLVMFSSMNCLLGTARSISSNYIQTLQNSKNSKAIVSNT